jgi:cytochrome c556
MRILLITAAASLTLLTGCRQSPENQPGRSAANASGTAIGAAHLAAASAKPLGKEQALAVMHERHEGMEQIGKAAKSIGRELKSDKPDLATVRNSAATLTHLSAKASGWFPAGTGTEMGKTGAKAEIWQKPADFAAKLKAFEQAAPAFNAAAQSGDRAAITARFGELGKTCKACHDTYRADMHH